MIHNGVNELLHRKRGEQFRQQQNRRNSRTHVSSANLVRNKPTLPINLSSLENELDAIYSRDSTSNTPSDNPLSDPSQSTTTSKCSGPVPPKSWVRAQLISAQDTFLTPTWRADALSLLYQSLGVRSAEERVLPLSLLCLLPLVKNGACSDEELRQDVLPFIPQHLRKEVVRYTAVHHPLTEKRLLLMYEEDGHSDGEIIVMGPDANLSDDYFIQMTQASRKTDLKDAKPRNSALPDDDEDWERDDDSKILQVFAAVSTRLSRTAILSLPPTLTHLALIRLLAPIYLHRLPQICPLLVFLDLSYNKWLERPSDELQKSIARIDWTRWSHLQTLGWRNCMMLDVMSANLNKGRWDDITVIE